MNIETSQESQQQRCLVALFEEAWCKGQLDTVDALIAPLYRIEHDPGDPWEGQSIDQDTYKQRVQHARRIFPDLHFEPHDLIEQDKRVMVSWTMHGSHHGDLEQLSASGNTIEVPGMTIYYFNDDGKASGHYQVMDRAVLHDQLLGRNTTP